MRKKGISPLAIILTIVVVFVALIIAVVVKTQVPAVVESSWNGLIFWIIFIGIAGPGCFIVGRFFNRGGR